MYLYPVSYTHLAIVDNGAHFDGDQSGTVNGVTPPAVQHLHAEVTADSGEYQVLARWDTPKMCIRDRSFALKLAREMGRPDWRAMLAGRCV